MPSKLVFINAPTRNSDKSRAFYGALLGADFAHGFNPSVPSWWTPLDRGIDFTITHRYDDRERLTAYFAVDDLDAAIKQLVKLGGRCVVDPRDVLLGPDKARDFHVNQQQKDGHDVGDKDARTVGRMAIVLDPDLNHVGLIQLAPHAQRHFKAGQYQEKLDRQEAAAFAATKKLADKLEAAGELPK